MHWSSHIQPSGHTWKVWVLRVFLFVARQPKVCTGTTACHRGCYLHNKHKRLSFMPFGWIWIRDPRNQVAAVLHFRQHGHQDWPRGLVLFGAYGGDLFVNFMLNSLLDGPVKHIQCTDWAMHFGLFVMWFDLVWNIQTARPFAYICPVIHTCGIILYNHAMHSSHYSQL